MTEDWPDAVTETPPHPEYFCPDCGWAFSVHERDEDGRKRCPPNQVVPSHLMDS